LYAVERARHPAPLVPVRIWVQPFTVADSSLLDEADYARFTLEQSLHDARKDLVPWQTRYAGKKWLERLEPDLDGDAPSAATMIKAAYVVTGRYTADGLEMVTFRLDWLGKVKKRWELRSGGTNAFYRGRAAATTLLETWGEAVETTDLYASLTPPVARSLWKSSVLEDNAAIRDTLFAGFTSPDSAALRLWEALALHFLDWSWPNWEPEAEHAMKRTLELRSRSSDGLYTFGMLRWRNIEGRREAIDSWKLAHMTDRRNVDPLLSLSWLEPEEIEDLRIGDKEQILHYTLRIRPTEPYVRSALAGYYRKQLVQVSTALRMYKEGLELNPDQMRLRMGRGVVYLSTQDWELAADDFRHIVELDSTIANAWYNYGIALFSMRDFEAAEHAFSNAIEYDGPRDAFFYLGRVYDYWKQWDKALDQYRRRWVERDLDRVDEYADQSQERIREIQISRIRGEEPPPIPGLHEVESDTTQGAAEPVDVEPAG
ncbi:tetratricopeptide repeat protein, partial [bacterium]|nr:tetratricopeptide repeat protein [bacterium]